METLNRFPVERIWRYLGRVVLYIVILAGAFLVSLPFLFMISTSLKTNEQVFAWPIQWIPRPVVWRNYIEAWVGFVPFTVFLKNSLIVSLGCVVGVILSASVVAFSFARLRWFGRDFFFILTLSTIMLPFYAVMIPRFILFKYLGWINTFYPLIVPWFFGGGPFNIFLLRQFFMTIPLELDDAAKIDGCGTFGIFWRIIMPLSKPALTAVAILHFVFEWKDFVGPLIFINEKPKFTLSLGLALFRTESEVYWNMLMAASVLVMLPPMIIYFFAQRYFIQGIVVTGLKG
ncbi:MAG: carbohydrate ABC transporter permease [bacterium]